MRREEYAMVFLAERDERAPDVQGGLAWSNSRRLVTAPSRSHREITRSVSTLPMPYDTQPAVALSHRNSCRPRPFEGRLGIGAGQGLVGFAPRRRDRSLVEFMARCDSPADHGRLPGS
jgi:hypothetical protein